MVALKHYIEGRIGRPEMRSRNAVVALKRASWAATSASAASKQERRGGIETRATSRKRCRYTTKQERRGGIETSWGRRPRSGGPAGSRNAVVALKLPEGDASDGIRKEKQERRGGIETMACQIPGG